MLAYSFLVLQPLVPRPTTSADGDLFPLTPCALSARDLTLPAAHRLVRVWLFQGLVQWLLETGQIKAFRPRRI